MIYIQIPEEHDAKGFLLWAKSGAPVTSVSLTTFMESVQNISNYSSGEGSLLRDCRPRAYPCRNLLSPHEKYEIYLPLKYNDGREIEAEKFNKFVSS